MNLFLREHQLMSANKIGMWQRWPWGKLSSLLVVVKALDLNLVCFFYNHAKLYSICTFRCEALISGVLPDMLLELARREKNAGIKPDEDLDIFMKVLSHFINYSLLRESISLLHKLIYSRFFLQSLALGGQETNLVVEYIMKVISKYCYSWMHGELSCDYDLKYLMAWVFQFLNYFFSTNGIQDAKWFCFVGYNTWVCSGSEKSCMRRIRERMVDHNS